jgi:hypothetical protein
LRALLVGSELPACSIRRILLAEIFAGLFQFEPGHPAAVAKIGRAETPQQALQQLRLGEVRSKVTETK